MKKLVALISAAVLVTSVAAFAGPGKDGGKKTAKVTDVWTCPIQMAAVTNHANPEKGTTVGKYRVHFCCAGCPG